MISDPGHGTKTPLIAATASRNRMNRNMRTPPFRNGEQMRRVLAITLGLLTALMLYVTLTVPSIAATAPAILAVALGVATWFVWPKHRNQ